MAISSAPFFINRNVDILLTKLAAAAGPGAVTIDAQLAKLVEEVDECLEARAALLAKGGGSSRELLLEIVDVMVVCTMAGKVLGRRWGDLEKLVEAKLQRNVERNWVLGPNGAGQHVEEVEP